MLLQDKRPDTDPVAPSPGSALVRVLALNPGSSSLRFEILRIEAACPSSSTQTKRDDRPESLASGSVAGIGPHARAKAGIGSVQREIAAVRASDAREAIDWALGWLADEGLSDTVEAVGVRVVHAGLQEHAAALVTPELEAEIDRLDELDPLHNAASLSAIRAARSSFPRAVPIAAVFDTAFHAGMPEIAWRYALPWDLQEKHGIRRFGFHGLAIASVLEQHAREREQDERIVVLHLGSGASVTAVRGGRCVDTSMGFSPLEGLVMSTRSGDLDPSIVAHLARAETVGADQVVRWLHERSGLLGLSGRSGDMREIERLRAAGDRRATLAFDLFVHRAKKHLGAMIATLGGVDAVLFSGGIGENSAAIRERVCRDAAWLGVELDPTANAAGGPRIGTSGARVSAWTIPTNEELMIARHTHRLLS
jgi:acetate kinase